MSYLSKFGDIEIFNIAIYLELPDILKYSQINKRLRDLIYNNDFFWKKKFINDYGFECKNNYIYRYISLMHAWVFGDFNNTNLWHFWQLGSMKISQMSCGRYHNIYLDLNDDIWVSGRNNYGQLGLQDYDIRFYPVKIPKIKGLKIAAADTSTFIIDLDYNIWTFGDNNNKQLGINIFIFSDTYTPTKIPNIKAKEISVGANYAMIIDLENNVNIFGKNYCGMISNKGKTIIPNIKAKQIAAGYNHLVIMDIFNDVWTYGINNNGQLGLGDNNNRTIPTKISNIKAKKIFAGVCRTFIIDFDDNIWAFGINNYKQLCLDDINDRNIPTKVPYLKAKKISMGTNFTMIIDLNNKVWISGIFYVQYPYMITADHILRRIHKVKAINISANYEHAMIIGHIKENII